LRWIEWCARRKVSSVKGLVIAEESVDFLLLDEFTVCIFVGFYLCTTSREDHIVDQLRDAFAIGICEDFADHAFQEGLILKL
jgi:hypothetical protein